MIAIRVEPEYRSIARSLSGWGPKGEPNAPITAESEVVDSLKLTRSCNCSSGLLENVRVLNETRIPTEDEDDMLPRSG
jgi:hypothetical protein